MVSERHSENRRIIKNSMMLYVRTFITMVVGLYTSRVVLEVLGVDDFGVYGVVGSLVIVFGFFQNTMASAMSRFLSFELGRSDRSRLSDTFSASLIVVAAIALFIVAVCETGGIWFVGRLNIPEASRSAAMWVFQFSVATVILHIIQTAYSSALVAHESFDVFAYLEIANSVLKLGSVFLLKFVVVNKLELYGFLVMLVALILALINIIYCRRHFEECRGIHRVDMAVIRPMLTYSGWSLYKTGADMMKPTGVNVLVNLFFGVALNAAVAIAMNVGANIFKFVSGVFLSFKPQIIKTYAAGAIDRMQELLDNALRFSLSVQILVSVPLFIEMPYVLRIWLGSVPDYAVVFCRLIVLSFLCDVFLSIVEYGINATGRIRAYSLLNGTLTLMIMAVGWVCYRLGAPAPSIYVVQIAVLFLLINLDLLLLRRLIPGYRIGKVYRIMAALGFIGVLAFAASYMAGRLTDSDGFLRFLVVGLADVLVTGTLVYIFILTPSARLALKRKLHIGCLRAKN